MDEARLAQCRCSAGLAAPLWLPLPAELTRAAAQPSSLPHAPLQGQAEAHLPFLEEQQGTVLHATDPEGGKHAFRFRFWVNNQSRWATRLVCG